MTRPQTEVRDGTIVAGYRVLGVLGIGGSGTVYRAEHIESGALVALKLLNSEHASNDGERQRFMREAEVVRQLAHPHVVALLEYGFVDDLPFLVFPLLEGRTLEARIAAEGKVGWGLTGRFSEQALSALEVAHGLSIAHRDIKPANIYCHRSEAGESIRILDFGTAKIVGPKPAPREEVTRYGALIGTPRYMAPEQVRGETLTPAADVYSFGLVMAEMLLGRPLVTGETDFQMYVEQGSDTPHVLPEEILSSPFAAVIQRAVAKPLDVRYRLAGQMLADVRAILARYEQGGASQKHGADLEATKFFRIAPEPAPVNEGAEKLRKAFNAVASRAQTAPAPTSGPTSDPTAMPTMVLPSVSDETTSGPTAPVPIPADVAALDAPTLDLPAPSSLSAPDVPVARAAPPAKASRTMVVLSVGAVLAVGGVVGLFAHRASTSPAAPQVSASAAATSDAAASAPSSSVLAAAVSSAPAAAAAPSPTAPPGSFTTDPVDPSALTHLLADKAAKQTPELFELALKGMAGCEIAVGTPPTCPAWSAYEATLQRPLAKGGAKKRLAIATKYLGHAAPSVRILAARVHASAKSDEDVGGLLAAAKVEPSPAVLGEMMASMTRSRADVVAFKLEALRHADERVRAQAARSLGGAADQPNVIEALGKALASDASPLVKGAACAGLAGKPDAMPLDPVKSAAKSAEGVVRTECFAALTAAWVQTPAPRKEAYDATLVILDEKPRDASHLPEGLGRIPDATVSFPPSNTGGRKWLERATFYDAKRLCNLLEDVALDPAAGLALRRAALDALVPIDGAKRAASVRKKLAAMDDEGSKVLAVKPKKGDEKKKPAP
jgi:serine/threonine protein kinase